jgi:hypothetical protein
MVFNCFLCGTKSLLIFTLWDAVIVSALNSASFFLEHRRFGLEAQTIDPDLP